MRSLLIGICMSLVVIMPSLIACDINTDSGKDSQTQSPPPKNDFKAKYTLLFQTKRRAQQDAVKRLLESDDDATQRQMVEMLAKKLFATLKTSLATVNGWGIDKALDHEQLNSNQDLASDMSVVLENTAFAADLALVLPQAFHKCFDKRDEWRSTLESALDFSTKSSLMDEATNKSVHLMRQELGLIEKETGYTNPYYKKKRRLDELNQVDASVPPPPSSTPKTKKKKDKKKKGPGLSGANHANNEL